MTHDVREPTVLIVDDQLDNLRSLARILRRSGFVPRPVTNGESAIRAALEELPTLVMLDVNMPGMSGLDVCRWFKRDARLADVPIIFLSGLQRSEDKVEALSVGGVDYVTKPFNAAEVVMRVRTHVHLRQLQLGILGRNEELERRVAEQVKVATAAQLAIIFALAKLAEVRDDDTGKHIERVQIFTRTLARQMQTTQEYGSQLSDERIDIFAQSASLHDIGKVGIPDAILLKPAKLTSEEFEAMKQHTVLGAATLEKVLNRHPESQFLEVGVEVARSHHERWDGRGYPQALREAEIPLSARIVALADFYDALTSNRCYRPAFSHEDTARMILAATGSHFEPSVVVAFEKTRDEFRQIRAGLEG